MWEVVPVAAVREDDGMVPYEEPNLEREVKKASLAVFTASV